MQVRRQHRQRRFRSTGRHHRRAVKSNIILWDHFGLSDDDFENDYDDDDDDDDGGGGGGGGTAKWMNNNNNNNNC